MHKAIKIIFLFFLLFTVCSTLIWAAQEAAKQTKETELKGVKIDPAVIKALESLSEKDPMFALRVYYLVAEGYQAQNQIGQALAILESASQAFPKQTDILNRLVSLYQQQAKYDKVIEIAKQLSKLQPDNIYYQQTIANAYFAKGEKDAGVAIMLDLAKARSDDANAQAQVAQALQIQGKPEEALKYFEAAAKLKPQETGFMQQLGQAYIANKKLDEAKKIYERIASTSKEVWTQHDAGRQLVAIAMQQNALDALIAEAEAAISKDPLNLNNHWKLIEAYSMGNKLNDSVIALERAVKQFTDNQELSQRLIGSYQGQGKWDKAIEILKEQVTKNPKDTGLRTQLAQVYGNAGKPKEAVATLEEAAKADPNNSMMYGEQIAEAYMRANQLDDAIKQFEALKAKATEDWRKTNYSSRIEQLKLQKQQLQVKPASQPEEKK